MNRSREKERSRELRKHRNPGGVRSEQQHQVIERVTGEDHQRPLRAETSVKQRLRQSVRRRSRVAPSQLAPAVAVTLGCQQAFRMRSSVRAEDVSHAPGMGLEQLSRRDQRAAVGTPLLRDLRRSEQFDHDVDMLRDRHLTWAPFAARRQAG
jgi:hypothetical protein